MSKLIVSAASGLLLLAFSSVSTVGGNYQSAILSQGPVGYWRLNETKVPPPPPPAASIGTLGSGVNGQYIGNATRGEPGAFPGTTATSVGFHNPHQDPTLANSKVEVAYNAALNPSGAFSVEFWAKPSLVVTDVFCLAASINSATNIGSPNPRAGWLFYQVGSTNTTNNTWQFRLGNNSNYQDGSNVLGGVVTIGTWHHIVGVFDGTSASLYVNGGKVASHIITNYQANSARPFRIGSTDFDGAGSAPNTFAGNRGFNGWIQEVAFYNTALSAGDVAAHYGAGQTNGANYASVILAKRPLGYWRLGEAADPLAANLGSLGAAANGHYIYAANPGQPGPRPPAFAGLESTNVACALTGTSGYVDLPPLNINTNAFTLTAWVYSTAIETNNAAIVFCRDGTTIAGLKFDVNDPNGLSYNWNGDSSSINFKSSLPVPVGQWAFVALIIQPDQAVLCLQDGTAFNTATNYDTNPEQPFDGDLLIGRDSSDATLTFNGSLDEVAVFNRSLSVGEVFSEYAAAVGNVAPQLFTDLQAPANLVYVGDTLTLSVDAGGTPPLGYQWRANGTAIVGATLPTFTKAHVAAADSATYDVVVTNAQGTVTSQKLNLSVSPIAAPTISQDIQGRTLYAGGSVSLSVQASGGQLAYQWQRGGTNLIGATNATYLIPSASATNAGTYQVIISNSLGHATSATAAVGVIVPAAGSYEATILADSPESWWRLDDPVGSGTMTDAMGRHDGIYKGGVTLGAPGVIAGSTNTAASFDGSSGYGAVPFSRALNTTNFTIECWAWANPVVPALCPVSSFTQPPGRGYMFFKSVDGEWFYLYGTGTDPRMFVASGGDATYSKWTHLVATYDGTTFQGYLNGVLQVSGPASIVPNNTSPLRIGYDQAGNGWNDFWDGSIDEVLYYQKALTPEQVAAHYAAALYGANSKPVFVQPPLSQAAVVGTRIALAPTVEGSVPIAMGWTKNGVPIPGATNATLVLTNLAVTSSGVYQLTATNASGTATSTAANLAVLPKPTFANVTNGLVLLLKFEGDDKDTSGHNNNGLGLGSPQFVTGEVDLGAVRVSTAVDKTDPNNPIVTAANYVTLGKTHTDLQFSSNVNFSVSYWVRFTGSPGDLPFFCSAVNSFTGAGFDFAPSYQQGGWSWSLGTVGTTDYVGIYGQPGTLNDGLWHHLAHTFDRTGSGITYLDGFFVDSRSIVPIGNIDSGQPVTIGQDPTGSYPEAAQYDLDDLAVWRRVLNPFEVYSIYAVGQKGISLDATAQPKLFALRADGQIQLVWQAGTLLQADDPKGPWSPVGGASAPFYQVAPTAAKKFFRVQL